MINIVFSPFLFVPYFVLFRFYCIFVLCIAYTKATSMATAYPAGLPATHSNLRIPTDRSRAVHLWLRAEPRLHSSHL